MEMQCFRQVNYLIDEASDVGKGANTTISFVHHYFHNHGLGETHVKLYAVSYVSSLYELAQMVESSSTVGVNKAQLVGTHDGKVIVPVYNWSAFLEQYFVRVPNIKKFHHFRFSKDEPGRLYFKLYSTSPEQSLQLLKNPAILPPAMLPPKVNSQGLSQERKQYLYREIHQFCKPGMEDLVAPAP